MSFKLTYFLPLLFLFGACTSKENKGRNSYHDESEIIFQTDFLEELNQDIWKIEMDSSANSSVHIQDGKLVFDTENGVTVWLDLVLEGNYEISYNRKIVLDSGKNDRLSDLNQFWAASDSTDIGMFNRSGKFESYDDLQLYYVGFGGNHNSTTRFRKYHQGKKPVIEEYLSAPYLLKPNHDYQIKTVCRDGKLEFWVNDVLFFDFEDPEPLTKGYFGFRSTWSRQEISNFKITRL